MPSRAVTLGRRLHLLPERLSALTRLASGRLTHRDLTFVGVGQRRPQEAAAPPGYHGSGAQARKVKGLHPGRFTDGETEAGSQGECVRVGGPRSGECEPVLGLHPLCRTHRTTAFANGIFWHHWCVQRRTAQQSSGVYGNQVCGPLPGSLPRLPGSLRAIRKEAEHTGGR